MSNTVTPAVSTLLETAIIQEGLKSEWCESKMNRMEAAKAMATAAAAVAAKKSDAPADAKAAPAGLPKILTKGAGITLGQSNNGTTASASPQSSSAASKLDPTRFEEGDGIEICPLSIATCEEIAERIVASGGASLIIDYGENWTPEDSLRGFKKHGQVSVLSEVSSGAAFASIASNICLC